MKVVATWALHGLASQLMRMRNPAHIILEGIPTPKRAHI